MKNYPIQLSAFIAIRDVEKYIEEWINFYLLVGVQHFVIYDYGSKDNTPELIHPYIKRGIVDYRYFTPPYLNEVKRVHPNRWFEALSLSHRLDTLNEYKTICKWMCFFDLDEFTFPFDENKNLLDVLQNYEEFAALHVNWVFFGDSDQEKYNNDYVINRFNRRASLKWKDNDHCKVICRPDRVDLDKSALAVNPHYFFYKDGYIGVNEDKERVGMSYKRVDGKVYRNEHPAFSPHPERRKIIRCNHYHFKSSEEFREKLDKHVKGGINQRHREQSFMFNEEQDDLIKRYIPLLDSINLDNYSS